MAFSIMIVDDSPVMRSFIIRILKMSGLEIRECLEASDGEEALAKLRQHNVDVILSDINMPKMDGEELMRALAADPELVSIPVIVVSTDRTEGRLKIMQSLGAKGYVTKPFSPELLRAEMERVMEAANGGARV
jgi:two-component system chemotaxis response regulator CheY